jgi:hypothetical protein
MNVITAAIAQGKMYGYLTKIGNLSNVSGHLKAGDSTVADVGWDFGLKLIRLLTGSTNDSTGYTSKTPAKPGKHVSDCVG